MKYDTVSDNERKPTGTVPDNKSDTVSEKLYIPVTSASTSYCSSQEDRRPDSKSQPNTDSRHNPLSNVSNHSNTIECKNNNYSYSSNRERNKQEVYKDTPRRTRNIKPKRIFREENGNNI